jgi:hypothetical protein
MDNQKLKKDEESIFDKIKPLMDIQNDIEKDYALRAGLVISARHLVVAIPNHCIRKIRNLFGLKSEFSDVIASTHSNKCPPSKDVGQAFIDSDSGLKHEIPLERRCDLLYQYSKAYGELDAKRKKSVYVQYQKEMGKDGNSCKIIRNVNFEKDSPTMKENEEWI